MSEVLFLLSEAFYRLSKLHFCSIKIFQSAFHFSSNFKIDFTYLLQWMNYIKTCIVITTKVMELSNTKILTNIFFLKIKIPTFEVYFRYNAHEKHKHTHKFIFINMYIRVCLSWPKPVFQNLEHDQHINIKFTLILTQTNLSWRCLTRIVSCIPFYFLA